MGSVTHCEECKREGNFKFQEGLYEEVSAFLTSLLALL